MGVRFPHAGPLRIFMAKAKSTTENKRTHVSVAKLTKIGGKFKTSSMNKHEKKSFKKYRGQGR